MPVMSCGRAPKQSLQYSLYVRLEPEGKARLHRIARCTGEMFVGNDAHARLERFLAGDELSYRLSEPPDGAVGREHELPVRRLCEPGRAHVDLSGQRLLRRTGERLRFRAGSRRIGRESESVEPADGMPFDHDFAALADVRLEHRVLAQPTHQYAGTAIDEAFGQAFVQGVRQSVLDRAGHALPVLGVSEPVRTIGGKG